LPSRAACRGASGVGLQVLVDGVADLAFQRPQCLFGCLALGDFLVVVSTAAAVVVADLGRRRVASGGSSGYIFIASPLVPRDAARSSLSRLRLVADGYESENRREEHLRLARPLQRSPPGGHLLGGDLAGLRGPVNGSRLKLLVDGEPGSSRQADDVRDDSHVTQADPPEQPEELAADPGLRHRRIQHLRNPACQRRVRCIDHGLIRVEVKGQPKMASVSAG
jgi:hypothetical protein